MNPPPNEEALFQTAAPLPPADRAAFLDRECAGTPVRVADGETGAVAFSPDGRKLVTGLFDGRVVIWDLATRRAWILLDMFFSVDCAF